MNRSQISISPSNVFVDVLMPLALPSNLTYAVPPELVDQLKWGTRVVVQLRDRKMYTALVVKIHDVKPTFETKDIISIIDALPIINPKQYDLWIWVSKYYMCLLGEVMKAALPSALKMESKTKIYAHADYHEFEGIERELLFTLSQRSFTIEELSKTLGKKNVLKPIKNLLEQNALSVSEQLVDKYRAKSQTFVKLHSTIINENQLNTILNSLSRAPQQHKLLNSFLEKALPDLFINRLELDKKTFMQLPAYSASVLTACIQKNIFELVVQNQSRLSDFDQAIKDLPVLKGQQIQAKEKIDLAFKQSKPALLHGVTSSGKTEIYIHCIDEVLKRGQQVLYLLPEIALTTQITNRLQTVLGNQIGVYHSRFSDSERVEIYQQVLDKGYTQTPYLILGARSAVFLPFSNLGLIIVDEEHESSYKQLDPNPRYNARDAALVLARIHHANVLLGSATPSIESYNNARMDRYTLVEITERYGNLALPTIEVVDMVQARKKKTVQGYFSNQLIDAIAQTLAKNEQVILFQNRRGFASYIECNNCGDVPHCLYCDVSLTYHKQGSLLSCHYCGYGILIPSVCSKCGSSEVKTCGFGTEKVEDDLGFIFPDTVIERLDLDSTRKKHAYEQILERFEQQDISILVGTQMITKGLDFSNVSLVGVLNADNMLNFPDFRAHERSFQLMSQVAGRAGRRLKEGKVLIQTSSPQHPIINFVVEHNYWGLYKDQAEERKTFFYPPFCRLIILTLKHTKFEILQAAAAQMKHLLQALFDKQVAGPEAPEVKRIQNLFLLNFRIKLQRDANQIHLKVLIQECFDSLKASNKLYSALILSADVDPV